MNGISIGQTVPQAANATNLWRTQWRHILDWLSLCQERARQRRALLRLDARLLADIGVDCVQAQREAAKPCWRR